LPLNLTAVRAGVRTTAPWRSFPGDQRSIIRVRGPRRFGDLLLETLSENFRGHWRGGSAALALSPEFSYINATRDGPRTFFGALSQSVYGPSTPPGGWLHPSVPPHLVGYRFAHPYPKKKKKENGERSCGMSGRAANGSLGWCRSRYEYPKNPANAPQWIFFL